MADQIVITEKFSQAKDVRAAVGARYGDILPAEGHLLDLLEPEDVVPEWKRWSPILLRPEGLYGTRPAQVATKPPSLGSFARHCAPPSGFGSPPIAIARVSS
jgi:DNA topoisomerase III